MRRQGRYRWINNIDLKIPRHFSPEAADLVRAVSIISFSCTISCFSADLIP